METVKKEIGLDEDPKKKEEKEEDPSQTKSKNKPIITDKTKIDPVSEPEMEKKKDESPRVNRFGFPVRTSKEVMMAKNQFRF